MKFIKTLVLIAGLLLAAVSAKADGYQALLGGTNNVARATTNTLNAAATFVRTRSVTLSTRLVPTSTISGTAAIGVQYSTDAATNTWVNWGTLTQTFDGTTNLQVLNTNIDTGGAKNWRVSTYANTNASTDFTNLTVVFDGKAGL